MLQNMGALRCFYPVDVIFIFFCRRVTRGCLHLAQSPAGFARVSVSNYLDTSCTPFLTLKSFHSETGVLHFLHHDLPKKLNAENLWYDKRDSPRAGLGSAGFILSFCCSFPPLPSTPFWQYPGYKWSCTPPPHLFRLSEKGTDHFIFTSVALNPCA